MRAATKSRPSAAPAPSPPPAPYPQVRAWDKSGDQEFSLREFLIMMKAVILTSALHGTHAIAENHHTPNPPPPTPAPAPPTPPPPPPHPGTDAVADNALFGLAKTVAEDSKEKEKSPPQSKLDRHKLTGKPAAVSKLGGIRRLTQGPDLLASYLWQSPTSTTRGSHRAQRSAMRAAPRAHCLIELHAPCPPTAGRIKFGALKECDNFTSTEELLEHEPGVGDFDSTRLDSTEPGSL